MTQILNPCSPLSRDVILPLTGWPMSYGVRTVTIKAPERRRVVEARRPFWAPADPPSDRTVAYVKAQLHSS